MACKRIIRSAEAVELFRDRLGTRPFFGALKTEMFQKMGNAVYSFFFIFRTGLGEYENGRRKALWHRNHNNTDAARKCFLFKVHT